MLKDPFNKILDISNSGDWEWLLMTGNYIPDAIVDTPNAISPVAHRCGVQMQKGYAATMPCPGPDKIPMTWVAILPTGYSNLETFSCLLSPSPLAALPSGRAASYPL